MVSEKLQVVVPCLCRPSQGLCRLQANSRFLHIFSMSLQSHEGGLQRPGGGLKRPGDSLKKKGANLKQALNILFYISIFTPNFDRRSTSSFFNVISTMAPVWIGGGENSPQQPNIYYRKDTLSKGKFVLFKISFSTIYLKHDYF